MPDVVPLLIYSRYWWLMLLPPWVWLADVIAKWQMEKPQVNVKISMLMFYAIPHPICEADGTCLCSYLGIDH